MRALIVLLAATALLAPLASADQSVSQGPASVATRNVDAGDGCESGDNGYQQRDANAQVQADAHERVFVDAASWCSAYSWADGYGDYDDQTDSGFGVSAGRASDNNPGPYVSVFTYDHTDDSSWTAPYRWCSTGAYVSGVSLLVGCLPEGMRAPMLPTLP